MTSKAKMYRSDQTENTLRKRAIDVAIMFGRVKRFDDYNHGYIDALKDLGVEQEYIDTYKRVVERVRKSYVTDRPYYKVLAKYKETE